jgi:hypothetical protein
LKTKTAIVISLVISTLASCVPSITATPIAIVASPYTAIPTETVAPTNTVPTSIPQVPQQLRITNSGRQDILGLVVIFPGPTILARGRRVEFGNIPAGETSDYRPIPNGVYRYAAYEYTLDNHLVHQAVMDWVGESPMEGAEFTYRITLNTQLPEGGQIQLVEVVLDASSLTNASILIVPTSRVELRAENFAFVFQDIPCGSIPLFVFDTNNNNLIYKPLAPLGDASSKIISIHLTDEELEIIYQKAIGISFFEYPPKFVIPDDKVIGSHFPVSSYQLSMTNGKMTNSVSWVDREVAEPDYTKAVELKELMILIQDIIRLRPEVQQYGEPKAGCA